MVGYFIIIQSVVYESIFVNIKMEAISSDFIYELVIKICNKCKLMKIVYYKNKQQPLK